MRYGALELAYAEPFAEALVANQPFRIWLLEQTKFAAEAKEAVILDSEMLAIRGPSATWWRSHYTEKCRCEGCRGQETDIFAVFSACGGWKFALHIEVKQPTDNFPSNKNQAENYALRADCWVKNPPKSILVHEAADTMLLCSETRLTDYMAHLSKFGAVITFEEIALEFPEATFSEVGKPK